MCTSLLICFRVYVCSRYVVVVKKFQLLMEDVVEHTLLINRSVKIYRIPPRPAAGGHRSGEWRIADEIFTGRLRVVAKQEQLDIRIEDAATGELFALCPCTPATQAVAVEPAADSSRYYVLRVEDPATQRHAFLGLGFTERGEAFDFNATLADHAKQCERERALACPAAAAAAKGAAGYDRLEDQQQHQQQLLGGLYTSPGDLSLKEGQTIKIDIHKLQRPSGFLSRALEAESTAAFGSSKAALAKGSLLPAPLIPPPRPSGAVPPAAGLLSLSSASPAAQQHSSAAAVTVASDPKDWATFD